jgi:hypothetical protein
VQQSLLKARGLAVGPGSTAVPDVRFESSLALTGIPRLQAGTGGV